MTITSLKTTEEKLPQLSRQKKIIEFLSSAFTATAQREFYNTKEEQKTALLKSHQPIIKEYRPFYALLLLAPINDLNKQIIVYNLLKQGKDIEKRIKRTENEIIFQVLSQMPIQRAFKTFRMLRKLSVNNARTRWLAQKFLSSRQNIYFEVIKYKAALKDLIIHNHLFVKNSEVFDFIFDKKKEFKNNLFKDYIKAKTDKEFIYKLPYSIAEGFAAYHKVDRSKFLKKIKGRMTEGEKLRMQETGKREGVKIEADWTKFKLVQLFKYLRTQARVPVKAKTIIKQLSKQIAENIPYEWKKVRVVLDNSGSSYASKEKKYHPIAVAQSLSAILEHKSKNFKEYFTNEDRKTKVLAPVGGATNLAKPTLQALKDKPDLLVIVSDGYENQPAMLTSQIVRAYKNKIDKENKTTICHINPVFAAEKGSTKELGEDIPSFGLLHVEQLATSFLLIEARKNLSEAIKNFEKYLLERKRTIDLNRLPNYLIEHKSK